MLRLLFLRFSITRPTTMGDIVDGSFFSDTLDGSTAAALAHPGFGTDVSPQQAAAAAAAAQADLTSADSEVAFGMQQASSLYLSGIRADQLDPSGWFVKTPLLNASTVDSQRQALFDSALAPKPTADPFEGSTTAAAGTPDVPQRAVHHFLQLLGNPNRDGAANLSLAG